MSRKHRTSKSKETQMKNREKNRKRRPKDQTARGMATSWPAQIHWSRIGKYLVVFLCPLPVRLNLKQTGTLSAAWKGGLRNAEQYAGDPDIRAAINRAMSFWFFNDFPSRNYWKHHWYLM